MNCKRGWANPAFLHSSRISWVLMEVTPPGRDQEVVLANGEAAGRVGAW